MKRYLGVLILIIVLVAASGCTQQTKTTPATTTVPTEMPTEIPTVAATTIETTAAPMTTVTTVSTTVAETKVVATVTAPAASNATTVVTVPTTIVTAGMTPSTKITVVHISNNTFTPSPLMVLPGTRITWDNDDNTIHSVKAIGTYQGKFNSGEIASKGQWGYDFGENEGIFEYADGYNKNVTGIIIVKKGESFYGQGTPTTYMTSNATW